MSRVLIGGVGYRWQGDASFGLVASDTLAGQAWPEHVDVADLGYGALYVTQDLSDAQPPYTRLVLLAGVSRGRRPGELYCSPWHPPAASPAEIQERVREAGAGVIDLDHLLVIGGHFGALPAEVVTLEFEPVDLVGAELSPAAAAKLPEALDLARREALAPSPLDSLYWRAEILQALYWMEGEGLASDVAPGRLADFLVTDEASVARQLAQLATSGYLEVLDGPRYRLSARGRAEGGRSFHDEFADYIKPAHAECGAGCWCTDPNHAGEPCPSTPEVPRGR